MYSQNVQGTSRKYGRNKANGRAAPKRGEIRRVRQLGACLIIFLTVFVGKGVFPDRINQVGERALELMGQNTDFRETFYAMGQALKGQGSIIGEVGDFCVAVFGPAQPETGWPLDERESQMKEEQRFLTSNPGYSETAAHYLRLEEIPSSWMPDEQSNLPEEVPAAAVEAVGTVLLHVDYQGPELPEGYTMDQLSLGALETVTPVFGPVWSKYGYRDHPIDGAHKFHNGVDIGADEGTPIACFGCGTVEYTGENDIYGNYLQIDHGQGIKSFYAHCSEILVRQDQYVAAGEKIALVGSTGTATGPHLHLELKCGGVHIDPAYYIQTKEAE